MPSFPSGAIERLPWKELQPHVILGDTRMTGHFAMSPLSRSLHRLRKQWNACEEWERYEQEAEDARARVRYMRRIQTPAAASPSEEQKQLPVEMPEMHVESVWDAVPRHPVHEPAKKDVNKSKSSSQALSPPPPPSKPAAPTESAVSKAPVTKTQPSIHLPPEVPDVKYRYREIYNEYLEARIRNL